MELMRGSVVVTDHDLVVDVPGSAAQRVALADLQELRFETGDDARLLVGAPSGTIAVPSRLVAITPRALDAQIRERAPHDRWPDPLAPIEPIASWTASPRVRVVAAVLGVGAAAAPVIAAIAADRPELVLPLPLALIVAVILLRIAATYRGTIALDRRGVFVERVGRCAFIAWSELDLASVELREDLGCLYRTLEVRSLRHVRGAPVRLRTTRVLGLGFPVAAICAQIHAAGAANR